MRVSQNVLSFSFNVVYVFACVYLPAKAVSRATNKRDISYNTQMLFTIRGVSWETYVFAMLTEHKYVQCRT